MNIEFDAPKHAYAIDGVRVPSVTQVLEPQNDWSMVEAWQLEAARALGQDVHTAVNLLAREVLDWESLDIALAPYVRGAKLFLEEFGGVVLAAEQMVASKRLGVAGTLDALLSKKRWIYFVDWKISAAVPSTVGAQLAAYMELYADMFCSGRKPLRAHRLCVRLRPNGYSCERMDAFNGDWALFQSCLNTFKHRERRSYV